MHQESPAPSFKFLVRLPPLLECLHDFDWYDPASQLNLSIRRIIFHKAQLRGVSRNREESKNPRLARPLVSLRSMTNVADLLAEFGAVLKEFGGFTPLVKP